MRATKIGGEGSLENVLAFVARDYDQVSFLELVPESKRHADKSGMKAYYSKTNDLTLIK